MPLNPGKVEEEPQSPKTGRSSTKDGANNGSPHSWWTDMVTELKEEEKKKGIEVEKKELTSNWWADLQKELEDVEKSPKNQTS